MAVISEQHAGNGRKAGVPRMKKHILKTDMTPLVDLGFLLIAFFVFTAEMSKPVVANLIMPHDGEGTKLQDSNALTVLLGENNRVWFYHGNMKDAIAANQFFETNYSLKDGIGKVIRDKQEWLDKANISAEKRNGLMLLIKATSKASYENIINALDEALINDVKKYALVKTEPEELSWIETHL
jgi:biopolymer transport protein ExbD